MTKGTTILQRGRVFKNFVEYVGNLVEWRVGIVVVLRRLKISIDHFGAMIVIKAVVKDSIQLIEWGPQLVVENIEKTRIKDLVILSESWDNQFAYIYYQNTGQGKIVDHPCHFIKIV